MVQLSKMSWMFIRRAITGYQFQLMKPNLSMSILRAVHNGAEAGSDLLLGSSNESVSSCCNRGLLCSPLGYKIDIVDDETWRASTGFAGFRNDVITPNQLPNNDKVVNSETRKLDDPDLDDIDDLRICGKLFYKLDKDSKEYEEYNVDFHRKKSSKRKSKPVQNEDQKPREIKTKRNPINNDQQKCYEMNRLEKSVIEKKQRVPTFNQLTGPYHEPFCLDVYISKASVRACIVHRATSKVVAVAHSISKDLKYELGSTRNAVACDAVGKVLAQRALADDIHNVVYTPRKGEKLEGKLQSVVQSVIDNGVWVKIKLKKKKVWKPGVQFVNDKPNYPSRW